MAPVYVYRAMDGSPGTWCAGQTFLRHACTHIYWEIFSVHLLSQHTHVHTRTQYIRKRTRICVLHWTCAPDIERIGRFQNGVSLTPNRVHNAQYVIITLFGYNVYVYNVYNIIIKEAHHCR